METASASVQSIDRVFDIIELLATTTNGLLLKDVSLQSGLHASTAYRLLSCLVERGYAHKDTSSGRYCLTLRFFEIGCKVSGVMDLVTLSKPFLDELSDFSQETVHLVKRSNNNVVYLYKAEPRQMLVRMASHVGGSSPLYCTGVGKAMLSQMDKQEVESVWNTSSIHQITNNTIVDLDILNAQLAAARRNGFAVDNEENEPGVYCVAAPILNWCNLPIAAVSVSAPSIRMTAEAKERIVPKLKEVTATISRQLGCVTTRK